LATKTGQEEEDYVPEDTPRNVEQYRNPEVFIAIKWWGNNIGYYDRLWHIRALKLYALWVNYHGYSRRKRINKFVSSWMDENEGYLDELADLMPNNTGCCASAHKLAYILTYFYYLRELSRAHP
jgi:hypothetical protein